MMTKTNEIAIIIKRERPIDFNYYLYFWEEFYLNVNLLVEFLNKNPKRLELIEEIAKELGESINIYNTKHLLTDKNVQKFIEEFNEFSEKKKIYRNRYRKRKRLPVQIELVEINKGSDVFYFIVNLDIELTINITIHIKYISSVAFAIIFDYLKREKIDDYSVSFRKRVLDKIKDIIIKTK